MYCISFAVIRIVNFHLESLLDIPAATVTKRGGTCRHFYKRSIVKCTVMIYLTNPRISEDT